MRIIKFSDLWGQNRKLENPINLIRLHSISIIRFKMKILRINEPGDIGHDSWLMIHMLYCRLKSKNGHSRVSRTVWSVLVRAFILSLLKSDSKVLDWMFKNVHGFGYFGWTDSKTFVAPAQDFQRFLGPVRSTRVRGPSFISWSWSGLILELQNSNSVILDTNRPWKLRRLFRSKLNSLSLDQ